MYQQVQAGTVVWLPVEFYDRNNNPVIPDSVSYIVYCQTTSTVVRAPTSATPGTSIEIELDTDDTAMQSASNDIEIRKVCVTSTYGAGDSRTDIFRFEVVRPENCS